MQDFKDKVAVITGAGSGFGREFARSGAALGMKLVLADVQADALAQTVSELESQGAEVLSQVVDVSDGAQVDALAAATFERFGATHLLFNNAGVGTVGFIWENSVRDWEWTLGVNLWGVIHGMRAFVPRMLAAAKATPGYRAHVVNTASMAGLINAPVGGVYNVSKHAVVSLTETLYHDLGLVTDQVHCSVLCPYYVPTGIHESSRNRPVGLANAAAPTPSQLVAQAMTSKAVTSGKVSAAQISGMTFDAIRREAFYILSHPQLAAGLREQAEAFLALRNPVDPFAAHPALRQQLEAALRTGGAA
jgi:NAD(P)-dependent dehydrogenase (short-subunit alcohol dehydrogenase family)